MLDITVFSSDITDVLERMTDAFLALDAEWKFTHVNLAASAIFGAEPEHLLGKYVWEAHPDVINTALYHQCRRSMSEQVSRSFNTYVESRQSWYDVRTYPSPNGLTVYARDVTMERRQSGGQDATRLLQESQQRYESLKRYNPNGICSLDQNLRFIGANPAFEMLTGHVLDELLKMSVTDILLPVDVASVHCKLSGDVRLLGDETAIRHKDGHGIDVMMTTVPIVIRGEKKGVYVIFQDVTEKRRVQQQLLEMQRLYRLISENSQDIILCVTSDGICSYISPSAHTLLGYLPQEIVGEPITGLFHPEDDVYVNDVGFKLLQGQEVDRFTGRIRLKNGSYRWYETTLKVVRDEAGRPVQIVGVGRDVSETIRMHETLAHAARMAGLGHWEWDVVSDNVYWSDQMHEIFGLSPTRDAHSLKTFKDFVHPEDRPIVGRSIKKSLESGGPFEREIRIVRADGSIRYLACQGEVTLDDEGTPVIVVGTCHDLTAWKQSRQMLQDIENRYQRLVDNSIDAVGIVQDGKWVFINRTGLALFGATCESDVVGRHYHDFLHPELQGVVKERIQAILSGQTLNTMEQKWFGLNGEMLHLEVRGTLFNENAVQVILRDVTERKRTAELISKSDKLSAVGQLAAGVAHEIRNPLTALKGFTQLLQQTAKDPEKRYFDILQSELRRIEMISNELLILAKPQSTIFKRHSITPILQEVIALLDTQAIMKNVVIDTKFESNPATDCDRNQLKQVFGNVIKNAIEAMPTGGRLFIGVVSQCRTIQIQFVDEGVGIPEDRIPKLGEPFFTTKEVGTGLGLMVSHNIVAAHQGSIKVTSEVGKGTTVSVVLPEALDEP